ncbi:LysM repeat protein [Novosphingobium chloroacetimidivorans]|uniref:LysM repeat protein n=1 Tax=Novosphingobium chloroacetimidivorans TaxID=1428314 RepID=A0A7W7KA59_9SPHN|nr:LysM peptidoglycan-binding domain-containing protein [Novosphingobium chloroacetimidivorans]MBB4858825.1 LysM repeat protein [Novosphingobium chloroacetimidivorans]
MNMQTNLSASGTRTNLTLEGLLAGAGGERSLGGSALDRLLSAPDTLSHLGPGANVHVVQRGETLSRIAARSGTTWQRLADINGIADPDRIQVGQHIRLPSPASTTHVVKPGETLSAIAQASGTTVAAIAGRNRIADPDRIYPGQALNLGGPSPSAPARAQAPAPAAPASARPEQAGVPQPGAASVEAADIAAQRAAGRSSIGRCYAWVKTALQKSGAVNDYIPGVAAKDAGPALEQRGFVNILGRPGTAIRSAYDAPKGAVLVYGAAPGATDRNARYGHIEIRTDGGFASDYASANARTGAAANGLTGRGRTLIGVYVKPDAGAQGTAPTQAPPNVPAGQALPAGQAYAAGNLSLGRNEGYRTAILEAADRTGMAPQTVAAIIDAEASKVGGVWQANARAGTSSATGLTQFLSGTWMGEATRPGSLLNQEAKALGLVNERNQVVDRSALLSARNDPRLSVLAGADYARHNLSALRESGHIAADASPAAVAKYAYIAHHEGLAGARGFLSGDMSYLRPGTFEANVPARQRDDYMGAAGGDQGNAYRNWLSDYIDRNIDVTRFMGDAQGVSVPPVRSLYR